MVRSSLLGFSYVQCVRPITQTAVKYRTWGNIFCPSFRKALVFRILLDLFVKFFALYHSSNMGSKLFYHTVVHNVLKLPSPSLPSLTNVCIREFKTTYDVLGVVRNCFTVAVLYSARNFHA